MQLEPRVLRIGSDGYVDCRYISFTFRTGRRRYPPALEALAVVFIFFPFLDASQMKTRIRLQEREAFECLLGRP
jgi:hypothetical protein